MYFPESSIPIEIERISTCKSLKAFINSIHGQWALNTYRKGAFRLIARIADNFAYPKLEEEPAESLEDFKNNYIFSEIEQKIKRIDT